MLQIKRSRKIENGPPGCVEVIARRGPFQTEHAEEGRPLLIELCPTFAVLRLKGKRQRLLLDYAEMWTRAAFRRADALRRARLEERKQARKQRAEKSRRR